MKIQNYNIHDIIRIEVKSKSKKYSRLVDNEYSFYKENEPTSKSPDIKLFLGPYKKPDLKNWQYIYEKYMISDCSIYIEDSYKVASWKVLIKYFNQDCTEIYFNGNIFSKYVLVKLYIEPIIRIKMMFKGYPMIHSSCLSNGEYGTVLPASPSVGKTTTLLNWLNEGNPFISDEYSILNNGTVYSYVTPFRFHSHNLKLNPIINNMPKIDKIQINMRTLLLKATRGFADLTWNIPVESVLPGINIKSSTRLSKICILTKWNGEKVKVEHIDKSEAVEKMASINYFEFRQFNNYFNAFSFIYPKLSLANYYEREKKAFLNAIDDCETFSVKLPAHYNSNVYKDIKNIIDS